MKVIRFATIFAMCAGIFACFTSCAKKSLDEQGIHLFMVSVPGGVLYMGNDSGEENEAPVHTVILSGFEMSKNEISVELYNKIMKVKENPLQEDPLVNVSWFDAIEFCNRLSKKAGYKPCYKVDGSNVACDFSANGFRLPTEAEWEYVAKQEKELVASDAERFDNINNGIAEWCYDYNGMYSESEQINPSGFESGSERIFRGKDGSASARGHAVPETKSDSISFRVCRSGSEYGKDVVSIKHEHDQKIFEANREKFAPLERMVTVTGGTFQMGNDGENGNEKPVHQVTLSDFEMGATEVTYKLYKDVIGRKPGEFIDGEDTPVQDASWYDAIYFCNKLSLLEGRVPCYKINGESDPAKWGEVPYTKIEGTTYGDQEAASYMSVIGNVSMWDSVTCDFTADGYRLPTEAEWEFAARGGINNSKTKYSGSDKLNEVAIHNGNWKHKFAPVAAQKKANALGIYDMSGSAWEWCWDWSSNYTQEAQTDPHGPSTGKSRVRRGGSVLDSVDTVDYTVSSRSSYEPCYSSNSNYPFEKAGLFGFRIVRTYK